MRDSQRLEKEQLRLTNFMHPVHPFGGKSRIVMTVGVKQLSDRGLSITSRRAIA